MRRFMRLPAILLLALIPVGVAAYEGDARREVGDGGTTQPVLTKPPVLEKFIPAHYPPSAEQRGLTAVVHMLVTIAADGSVSDAAVVRPVGDGFDEAALDAVRQFRFSPGEVDGAPAPVQVEYLYHFTLEAHREEPPPLPRAQGLLRGQLISRGSRARVPGASVHCANAPKQEAISDEDGRFELIVPPGECEIKVLANGFDPYQGRETLAADETREVTYHLVPRSSGYETVVRRERVEVARHTLERAEIQRIPGSFGDPIRVLQNLPGVARAPYVAGQLIVRGATPSETNTQMDGISIPILYHLGGGPSVVNPEFLDRVDFYPGGFGARYGRVIGGIVDVSPRKGATDTLHGVIKLDPLDSSAFLETPIGKNASVAGAIRRSYLDLLLPLFLSRDPNGGTLLVVPRYWDYKGRLDVGSLRPSDPRFGASSFYVMAFGANDLLRVVATGGGRNRDVSLDARTLFHRIKGDWTYRKANFSSVFAPYVGYDSDNGTFGTAFAFQADVSRIGAREDLKVEWARWVTLRGGGDLLFSHLSGSVEGALLSGIQER